MGEPRKAGEARYAPEAIAPGAPENGERYPVVGQDGVPETHSGCGRQQRCGRRAQALMAGVAAPEVRPRRRCSVCETASASNTPT